MGWGPKPEQGDTYSFLFGVSPVPATAGAVTYNLTVTQTEGGGYLALWKFGDPFPGASSINWLQSGTQLANGGVVELNTGGIASLYFGGPAGSRTHFIIDITGYYS